MAQDLRQLGGAEFTRSTAARRKFRQSDHGFGFHAAYYTVRRKESGLRREKP